MATTDWTGVIPAITTPFRDDDTIDLAFLAEHAAWMIDAGCTGVVSPGSLGEGAALSGGEKRDSRPGRRGGDPGPGRRGHCRRALREAVALASAALVRLRAP
ncbi:MAG: dihydrodipicolinate synthase family protein [Phycisphaerales bacterium]